MILLGLKCVTSIYPLRLYCGLCFCDVKDLTYKNIDYTNHLLKFEQNKTKGHSANSGVVIPLNDGLLSLIGEDPENLDSSIFNLPTYESCCKSVKRWVKRAGINKHISWHMARHTMATVVCLSNGMPIESVSSVLGHKCISSTQIYAKITNEKLNKEMNVLSEKLADIGEFVTSETFA